MKTKILNYVRDHECLACHNKWTSPVVLMDGSTRLSGERMEQCPKCESRSVMSLAAREPMENEK